MLTAKQVKDFGSSIQHNWILHVLPNTCTLTQTFLMPRVMQYVKNVQRHNLRTFTNKCTTLETTSSGGISEDYVMLSCLTHALALV